MSLAPKPQRGVGAGGGHLWIGVYYDALFLTIPNLAVRFSVKDKATVDAQCGYVYLSALADGHHCARRLRVGIHIGVGFGVARSDGKGNARALEWWDEHQASSHAFFICALSFINYPSTAL